ncbi:CHAT domain-containing protein [Aspergillus nidulans var. acristatus]
MEIQDCEDVVTDGKVALDAAPTDDHDRAGYLSDLSNELASLYWQTGNRQDLDAAIMNAELAVAATPDTHPNRADRLNKLSHHLSSRYMQTGSLQDIEAAIASANLAVAAAPESHPARPDCLYSLSYHLSSRYEQTGNFQDLENSIANADLAVAAAPENHPSLAGYLALLSYDLSCRYERTRNLQDLKAAIVNADLAVAVTPHDHPNRAVYLTRLSLRLLSGYERTGDMQYLEAAIANTDLAVAATPESHPDYAGRLNNLSNYLSSRYRRTGNLQDLDKAINNASLAVAAAPDGHPSRAGCLQTLSNQLYIRYERTGDPQELEAAITNAELAVAGTSETHPERAGCLHTLSNHLSRRYTRTGNLQDLEAAITNADLAMAATPDKHPDRPSTLNNLSHDLCTRYERTGNLHDLDAAIANIKLAVAATSSDNPNYAAFLSNLSYCLSRRYKRTRNLQDLADAIRNADLAVAATPDNHSDRAGRINNLSNRLLSRYEQTGNLQDLEAAIANANLAVATAPDNYPYQAIYLSNLSLCLSSRYEQSGNSQDLETALQCLIASANSLNAVPLRRIFSARRAIRILKQQNQWDDASLLAENAVRLLPLVCGRYLTREDQQHAIAQTAGLASDACSIFLQLRRPEKALQMLEFGRGLILGYLIDSRSDVDQLQHDHPALAKEYDRLRHILSQPLDAVLPESRNQLLQWKKRAPHELENCLATIRQQEGYEHFLLEPAIEDLTSQAAEGPVVIVNINDFGSHAIIVQDHKIRSLSLPDMLQTQNFALNEQVLRFRFAGERGHDLRDIESEPEPLDFLERLHTTRYDSSSLDWLWFHCVKLIIGEIKTQTQAPALGVLPRIWWIGTGVASSLPFHAAGDHNHPTENTISCAISSYIPSIKVLAYTRSCLARAPPQSSRTSVFIAAMPTTPNELPLPGVEPEVDAIQQASGHAYAVHLQKYPAPEAVLSAIEDTDIIHFACHGSSDPVNPSDSHLLLQNNNLTPPAVEKLTVQQISSCVFKRARIAYLSACSTAQVTATRLADEAIHLASAFQVAGFGHVIASLWTVDDATCTHMAGYFYGHLVKHQKTGTLSNRLVAEALHAAVLQVRSKQDPSVWASFIHCGA